MTSNAEKVNNFINPIENSEDILTETSDGVDTKTNFKHEDSIVNSESEQSIANYKNENRIIINTNNQSCSVHSDENQQCNHEISGYSKENDDENTVVLADNINPLSVRFPFDGIGGEQLRHHFAILNIEQRLLCLDEIEQRERTQAFLATFNCFPTNTGSPQPPEWSPSEPPPAYTPRKTSLMPYYNRS